jgi:hypothetical protein
MESNYRAPVGALVHIRRLWYPVADQGGSVHKAAPPADHEWNATIKRWQLTAATVAAQEARRAALAGIAALEGSQPRAVREALLGAPGALDRLKVLDAQIAALRPQLAS